MVHQFATLETRRALSIQQHFRFEISEMPLAQRNGTFWLHRPEPSHHVLLFGWTQKSSTGPTVFTNGKGHFGPTDRNDRTFKVDHL